MKKNMKDKLRKIKNFLPVFFSFLPLLFIRLIYVVHYLELGTEKVLVTNHVCLQKFLCVDSTFNYGRVMHFVFWSFVFFVFSVFSILKFTDQTQS